jgi:hypothetical protein
MADWTDGQRFDMSALESCPTYRTIDLTTKEYELLVYLLHHPRHVLSREQIAAAGAVDDGFDGDELWMPLVVAAAVIVVSVAAYMATRRRRHSDAQAHADGQRDRQLGVPGDPESSARARRSGQSLLVLVHRPANWR